MIYKDTHERYNQIFLKYINQLPKIPNMRGKVLPFKQFTLIIEELYDSYFIQECRGKKTSYFINYFDSYLRSKRSTNLIELHQI